MFAQYYEITFTSETYLNLTNVYNNLLIINNSPFQLQVYYRKILLCKLESYQEITLENVFTKLKNNKQFDENVQLYFYSSAGGLDTNIRLINYGE